MSENIFKSLNKLRVKTMNHFAILNHILSSLSLTDIFSKLVEIIDKSHIDPEAEI